MKSRKKFLIPLILAVVFLIVGAAGGIYINSRRADNVPPDHYFARSEQISSMTDIVGERSLAEAASEPASPEAEPAPEAAASGDNASIESSIEKESMEKESTENEEGETQAQSGSASDSPETKVYRYYSSENARQDVDSYIEYLKTEKNFIDITQAQQEEGEGTASGSAAAEASSGGDGSSQNGAGAEGQKRIHRLAGASQDSDSYLSITITEEEDGYTVTTVKENQPWAAYFTQLWDSALSQARPDSAEPQPSLASAEETVRAADQQLLGLSAPVNEYEFIAKRGLVRLNGNDYYCVSAYRSNATETFDYECAYLLDASSGKIMYRYDEATGDAQQLR